MLYSFLRFLTQAGIRGFFKKIYFYNEKLVPDGKPAILACNHPTTFLEPIVIAVTMSRPINFMVRGDVFKKPFYAMLLDKMHLIPIYRRKEGYDNLKLNDASFEEAGRRFLKNEPVIIFSEGSCIREKRLRSLKKGTARIAFTALESGLPDLAIVPVGANFTYQREFRDTLMIEFGEPLQTADYLDLYRENPAKAINKLTADLAVRMKAMVVHINDPADDEVTEQCLIVHRNSYYTPTLPIVEKTNTRLRYERLIANKINDMAGETKTILKDNANQYFNQLKTLGITDEGVAQVGYYRWHYTLMLIIGFLPFVFGKILSYPALAFGKRNAEKTHEIEYYAPIWFGSGYVFYMFYMLAWILVGLIAWNKMVWAFIAMIPLWSYFSFAYQEFFDIWNAERKANNLDKSVLQQLQAERVRCFELVSF
jgi:1-acyl-sn-glycerol-3-phosphate acyltransferase